MTEKGGFEEYQRTIADWIVELMRSKGKSIPDVTDFSKQEFELFNEVFRRFTGIQEAIDNLDLCLSFVSARTPRKKGLKLDSYLNYHIAFYLQEIYILKERLKKYAIKIMRLRKRLGHRVDRKTYKKFIDMVEQSLAPAINARGSHVHDRPFNDERMRMLGAYSFLAVQRPDETNWLEYARVEYAEIKRNWVTQLVANKQEINKLLDAYFSFLHIEVFASGLLVSPSNSFEPTPNHEPT